MSKQKKDYIRIIGDVHGLIDQAKTYGSTVGRTYLSVAKAAEWSIQVGDMGFDYSALSSVDPTKHRFFGGNHDNYDTIASVPHNLGDFGVVKVGGLSFFFCRGAFSIDKDLRIRDRLITKRKSWWSQEQLSHKQRWEVVKLWDKVKPEFVLTHTCPKSVSDMIGNPETLRHFGHDPKTFNTDTQKLLQCLFERHQPKLWCFGHFHKNWKRKVNGTEFVCIDELCFLVLNSKGGIVRRG